MRYLVVLLVLGWASAWAETPEHHFELGLGIGAVVSPDYRGSSEYQRTLSPIPYFVYRGRYFKADRDGIRSDLLQREWYELNFSASATVTPESHRTPLRAGMPNLYSTVELGPAVNINVTGERIKDGWMLSLPVHGVVAVSEDPEFVGWAFHPQVVRRWPIGGRTLSFRTGPYFANRQYHRHYYRVAEQYATPERREYDVGGGYSGWSSQVVLSQRRGRWWWGVYARYEHLGGATFVDSPLVETKHIVNMGGGISRVFF